MLKRPGSLTHYGIQAVQPWNRLRGAVVAASNTPKRAELANAGTLFYLVIRKRGLVE
jgi:hypothetical protein